MDHDQYRARNPGLRSFLAHVELKLKLGQNVGNWDTSSDPTAAVSDYYARIEREDYLFQISRPGPRAELAAETAAPADSGRAELPADLGTPVGAGQARLGEVSLARDVVTLAHDICSVGTSPVLAWEVSVRWPGAKPAARSAVRHALETTTDRCVRRILIGILERSSFTEADLRVLAKEPSPTSSISDGGDEAPQKPRRCFKFGVWSKEEYCF